VKTNRDVALFSMFLTNMTIYDIATVGRIQNRLSALNTSRFVEKNFIVSTPFVKITNESD
jgi:hypothetical protein